MKLLLLLLLLLLLQKLLLLQLLLLHVMLLLLQLLQLQLLLLLQELLLLRAHHCAARRRRGFHSLAFGAWCIHKVDGGGWPYHPLNGCALNGTALNGTALNGTALNGTALNGTNAASCCSRDNRLRLNRRVAYSYRSSRCNGSGRNGSRRCHGRWPIEELEATVQKDNVMWLDQGRRKVYFAIIGLEWQINKQQQQQKKRGLT